MNKKTIIGIVSVFLVLAALVYYNIPKPDSIEKAVSICEDGQEIKVSELYRSINEFEDEIGEECMDYSYSGQLRNDDGTWDNALKCVYCVDN